MGKGVASGYCQSQITICDGCFHREVCSNRDYMTDNTCGNFVKADFAIEALKLKERQEQGLVVEIPPSLKPHEYKTIADTISDLIHDVGFEDRSVGIIAAPDYEIEFYSDIVTRVERAAGAALGEKGDRDG